MASYVELKEKAEELLRQAEAARKVEISAVLADIKAKMAAYGITVADLGIKATASRSRKRKAENPGKAANASKAKVAKLANLVKVRKPVAAKYRNTETGETWSGRGKAPKWLVALESAGRKREEFAVFG